jgi:hypothetical protein
MEFSNFWNSESLSHLVEDILDVGSAHNAFAYIVQHKTRDYAHTSNGRQTHDPSVQAVQGSTWPRHSHNSDRRYFSCSV